MRLPLGFGSLDFGDWIRGLMSAVISGGASSVTAGFVVGAKDGDHFAVGSWNSIELMGTVFLATGILSGFNFLRTKPLPDVKVVKTTVETTSVAKKPDIVVKTVEETRMEPRSEPK